MNTRRRAKSRKSGRHRSRGGLEPLRRQFLVEPLEHRLLLDGESLAGDGLPPDELDIEPVVQEETASTANAQVQAESNDPAADEIQQFTRFESAEELEQYLVDDALRRYEWMFGQPAHHWRFWDYGPDILFLADTAMTAESAPSHSDTNVQVDGVDEADIVETDGNFLYVFSDNELVILDAFPADELQVASRVPISGQPLALFLRGDRLTVVSRLNQEYWIDGPVPMEPVMGTALMADMAIWPGPYERSEPRIQITVLDVTDREAPQIVQETELEGLYIDSRAVGDLVYVITSDRFELPQPRSHLVDGTGVIPGAIENADGTLPAEDWRAMPHQYVYETQEEYLAWIEGQVLELALPDYSSYGADGELVDAGPVTAPTDIYRPLRPEDNTLLSVVVFDVSEDTPGPASSTSVTTNHSANIYASAESLYVWGPDWFSGESSTSILKFDLQSESGNVEPVAAGSVPGRVLNQFSVDEYNGHLRVATTSNWGSRATNNIFVLEQDGSRLTTVGRLEDLAPGEQIYSARFMQDRAFVVTFRRVDPLFAIDLSDPTNPTVTGELKIPGFSNYLQAIDGEHLIGIGRDADPNTGRQQELQISLFGVGYSGNPELLDRYEFSPFDWTSSGATHDHHAVAYFPEYQVLAIPVVIVPSWFPSWPVAPAVVMEPPQYGLWVFHIDPYAYSSDGEGRGEISLLGRIEHDSAVRRSVRIEDLLYTISVDMVTVHQILDPETEVARLYFGDEVPGSVEVAEVDVELRVVRRPTPLGPNGQRTRPPASEEWIDEWDTFWTEVWVRSADGRGVTGGTVDLVYNQEFFTAVEIDHGPVFVSEPSGELDDINGMVTAMGGTTRRIDAGGEAWVLLGRVRFESFGDDDVPVGESSRPYGLGLELTTAQFEAFNADTVEVTLGDPPDTELWPVTFDVNDDGRVNFGDLAYLAGVFLKDVVHSDSSLAWTCDFDRSGRVDFGDFSFFAANFQHGRGSSRDVRFHTRFRQRWAGEPLDIEAGVSVDQVLDTAVDAWREVAELPESFDVQLAVHDLPEGQLGEARILEVDDEGHPLRGRVIIDDDAGGHGWHGDLERPVAGDKFDLFTVLVREIGHTLGLPDAVAGVAGQLPVAGGVSGFVGPVLADPIGEVLLRIIETSVPGDVMRAELAPGMRLLPMAGHASALAAAHDTTEDDGIAPAWDELVDEVEFEDLLPEL